MLVSNKITITGRVQGVGFRPYVYNLAKRFSIRGTVSNNEEGVIIFTTASSKNVNSFYNYLIENPPKVSKINGHEIDEIDIVEFSDFQIIPSETSGKLNLKLTPDFALCNDCRNDIFDVKNRRAQYAFTSCVYCGPRWAITETFPFERSHTSMKDFQMCEKCLNEYKDPSDRRFHSQTNSCSNCGISLQIINSKGELIECPKDEYFKKVAELILNGKIVAIKNVGGYLLCCDARNRKAIRELRKKKNRPTKPFAILYPNMALLKEQLPINQSNEKALTSPESPITIISKKEFKGHLALDDLAPNLSQLGVMLPYTALLQLIANELKVPIVATSGNIHGSPIISSDKLAITELKDVADYFLHHNLEINNPQDDSVVKYSFKYQQPVLFRRSRGYAPNFVGVYRTEERIMALGSHLKSTIAFLPNDYLYVSQYLGNLDNYSVYEWFVETSEKFISLFDQKPSIILVDMHPSYNSTRFGIELAKGLDIEYKFIQHHKAHFASVLGEHSLFGSEEPILGVVWDGTGYGDDSQIWGGEFFGYQQNSIERISHFEYFDWLAGDKMSKEPRLSLFSLVDDTSEIDFSDRFSSEELNVYRKLKAQNKLKTSSVGRLFDAVASLLNICHINTYEGEAAILLENYIQSYDWSNCQAYVTLSEDGTIPTSSILVAILSELKKEVSKEQIISNFLFTLAGLVFQIADIKGIFQIAFSGGVFQNTILRDMLKEMARDKYRLYFNCNLSPNDENVSYGQIMYYLHVNSQ